MKTNVLIASGIAAGVAATVFYFMKKNKKVQNQLQEALPSPVQQSRHLTNVFAKAKNQSSN